MKGSISLSKAVQLPTGSENATRYDALGKSARWAPRVSGSRQMVVKNYFWGARQVPKGHLVMILAWLDPRDRVRVVTVSIQSNKAQ